MVDIPNIPNITLYAGAAVALVIVLLILLLLARSRGGGIRTRYGQRLGVSEFHDIDKLRRLILVRRDGVEHLLLIGPNQDLLIESGINAAESKLPLGDEAPLLRRSPQRLEPAIENSERGEPPPWKSRMAPRPAVFGDRAPNLRSVEPDGPQLTSVRGDIEDPER
jgi:flagellar protein FliO/FliZ